MNKKALILVTSLLVIVVVGVGSLFYFLSFKTVAFTIVPDNTEIIVYDRDNDEVGRLALDGSLRLQSGDYRAVPTNEAYSLTSITFTVADQDMAVPIDPSYSFNRLNDILESEEPIIIQKLRDTYADVLDNFKIESGTLYQKGDWYATVITQDSLPGGQQGDVYRVVLHKVDNQWQIAAGPEIILTTPRHPDIPREILEDINTRN